MPDLEYFAGGPDLAHAGLAQAALDAASQLEEHLSRLDNAFYLLLSTADFADSTLATVLQVQAALTQMGGQLAALTARVDALEHPTPTPPPA